MAAWEAVLMPVAWAVTGLVLFYADRVVDARLDGSAPKRPGPVPFWWIFVWALPAGALAAVASGNATIPVVAQVVMTAVLTIAAAVAFSWRFGVRPGRRASSRTQGH